VITGGTVRVFKGDYTCDRRPGGKPMFALGSVPATVVPALFAIRFGIVIPLVLACLAVVVFIPMSARRGNLTIPVCVGMGLAAAVLAVGMGNLAGVKGIRGTAFAVLISIIFFLLVATAVGSFVGLYFFREPRQK
jgi:hypothetical protein